MSTTSSQQKPMAADPQQNSAYILKAIHKYTRRLNPERVEWCSGRAISVLKAMVSDGKLPKYYVLSPQNGESQAWHALLSEKEVFFQLAQLAKEIKKASENGTEMPAITERELAFVSSAGPAIAAASKRFLRFMPWLHGKSANRWMNKVILPIFNALGDRAEKDYGYKEKALSCYYKLKYTQPEKAEEALQTFGQ